MSKVMKLSKSLTASSKPNLVPTFGVHYHVGLGLSGRRSTCICMVMTSPADCPRGVRCQEGWLNGFVVWLAL